MSKAFLSPGYKNLIYDKIKLDLSFRRPEKAQVLNIY